MNRNHAMLLLLAGCIGASAPALEITGNTVVVAPKFTPAPGQKASLLPANQAVSILENHWERLFGKKLKVIRPQDYRGGTAIVLQEDRTLAPSEAVLRSDGKNLHIRGGYPKGVFFGARDFLEQFAGCRWFSTTNHYVPRQDKVVVPDGKDFRTKPLFTVERSCTGGSWTVQDAETWALTRTSDGYYCNGKHPPKGHLFAEWGWGECHTFHHFVKDLPNDSPMLPLSKDGGRVKAKNGNGPGQICFANPDFRKHVKKKIADIIAQQEDYFRKFGGNRESRMRYIDISQNDNHNWCQCPGCKELYQKYGSITGAMLEFINDIAAEYPDFLFQTFAYYETVQPPKGIKARDNVMIQFAFLQDKEGWIDVMRPLSHPANAPVRKLFQEWDNCCKHKAIWCYHRFYPMTEAFPAPQCSYWYIQEDFQFYHRIGAVKLLDESEVFIYRDSILPRSFDELHVYLSRKLLTDPYQNAQKLIDEYFDINYQEAAPPLRTYANYLRKRLEQVPGRLCRNPVKTRTCFDEDFFRTANDLLDQAENLVPNKPDVKERILLERLPLDWAAVNMWERVSHLYPSKDRLFQRVNMGIEAGLRRYRLRDGQKLEDIKAYNIAMNKLELLRNPIPMPKQFESLDAVQYVAKSFYNQNRFEDPEAAGGIAFKLAKPKEKQFDHDKQLMEVGVYNYPNKKWRVKYLFKPETIHQDERYHFYHIGRWDPQRGDHFWGHRSWELRIDALHDDIYVPQDPGREYDFYLSVKLTGPAYVKGSTKENAVYVDRLIAVKRGLRK